MPTGYTADVANGTVTDFRTFALRCARAFGATIMQREDPMNDPPKHREVSDHYVNAVSQAEARVKQLAAFDLNDANAEAGKEYRDAMRRYAEYVEKNTATRNRYNAMLAHVMAWEPPTPEHVEMKKFMIDQLTESRKFDTWHPERPTLRYAVTWLAEERQRAIDTLARARQSLAEEEARCKNANAWIDALYESLGAHPTEPGAAR